MTCNSLLRLLSHPAQLGLVSADPDCCPTRLQSRCDLNRRPPRGIRTGKSEWLSRKRARISKTQIIGRRPRAVAASDAVDWSHHEQPDASLSRGSPTLTHAGKPGRRSRARCGPGAVDASAARLLVDAAGPRPGGGRSARVLGNRGLTCPVQPGYAEALASPLGRLRGNSSATGSNASAARGAAVLGGIHHRHPVDQPHVDAPAGFGRTSGSAAKRGAFLVVLQCAGC